MSIGKTPRVEKIFPQRLREARNRAGLTQAALASRIRAGHATVGHLETGHQAPSFDNLCLIADALEVSLDWLAGYDVPVTAGVPTWLEELLPDLARLDLPSQQAVKALVLGLNTIKRS
jgi:transcriptional regulator with XRE-family HTH domain